MHGTAASGLSGAAFGRCRGGPLALRLAFLLHRIAPNTLTALKLEGGELRKKARAGVNFAALESGEALHAEFFYCEAAQHGTVHHRVAQRALVHFSRACEVAHEAAGKAVSRAGGIVYFFQWERRHGEEKVFVHHNGAVLATLDYQSFR